MLTQSTTTTMLPVSDVDRATRFYADSLGLSQTTTAMDGTPIFTVGRGDAIGFIPDQGERSKRTVLTFEVDDVASEISDLESRGVHFEDYDLPELRTVNHIAEMGDEKAAWFTDTEGNILCIHQDNRS